MLRFPHDPFQGQLCHHRVVRKLSFLHALTHVPVHKVTLGIHWAKLVVRASPGLSNSCSVAQHAHSSLYFGQVSTTTHHSGRLVINANFEASGTSVHKLNGVLGLDSGNGSFDIFGNQSSSSTSGNFIIDCGFKVYKHCPGHMLVRACLTEEGVEGAISLPNGLVTWHLAIGLDAMLQAAELPAGIADLDTRLVNMDGDALTLN